jgi:hypothetical protein
MCVCVCVLVYCVPKKSVDHAYACMCVCACVCVGLLCAQKSVHDVFYVSIKQFACKLSQKVWNDKCSR